MERYTFFVDPLSDEDGGGFLVTFPDLPGCHADGETVEEAINEARDAFAAWMEVQAERDVDIPQPGDAKEDAQMVIQEMRDTIESQSKEIDRLKAENNMLKAKRPGTSRWASIKAREHTAINPLLYAG